MTTAQYTSLETFLVVASAVFAAGILVAGSVTRRCGNFRGAIAALSLLSACTGAAAARAARIHPIHPQTIIDFWILFSPFVGWGRPLWGPYSMKSTKGQLIYELPRAGKQELIWSGRAILLMSAMEVILFGLRGMRVGWWDPLVLGIAVLIGLSGYFIAESFGCLEFRTGGILYGSRLYPWAKLGKFEWMAANPPLLRVQVRVRYGPSDVRMACPDSPEINAILVEHGLVRW